MLALLGTGSGINALTGASDNSIGAAALSGSRFGINALTGVSESNARNSADAQKMQYSLEKVRLSLQILYGHGYLENNIMLGYKPKLKAYEWYERQKEEGL